MKKSLLTVGLSVLTIAAFAQATCTPDVSCVPPSTTGAVCPDSASAIPLLTGTVGTPLSMVVSFKIPGTTQYSGQTVTLNQLAITNVQVKVGGSFSQLSSIGMDYLGAGSNTPTSGTGPSGVTMTKYCYFPAPAQAGKCVVFSGTPTMAGVFPLRISSQARGVISGFTTWAAAPENNSYYLTINANPNGLNSTIVDGSKFGLISVSPNPFVNSTTLLYNAPDAAKVVFTVYNVLGEQVYINTYAAQTGQNAIEFKANNLTAGMYIYTLSNGKETTTQRMVIEK